METPQKLAIVLPYEPTISFLGSLGPKVKNSIYKRHLHSYIHCSTVHSGPNLEIIQMSKIRRTDKIIVVYNAQWHITQLSPE